MSQTSLRVALVGAGTLLGKALHDELAASAFAAAEMRLIDDDEAMGKLAATADEITFIQRMEPDSFDGCDFTFFAGSRELTRTHWRQALDAGSRIVDLSGELEGEPGVPLRAPWVQDESSAAARLKSSSQPATLDLRTRAVVSAHPVAVLLALLGSRSQRLGPVATLWATLLQPASAYGHAALEELHRQTTNLLSFQPLPTEVFGGQTAFTLAVSFGDESHVALAKTADKIRGHYEKIVPEASASLALQVVQVPVFHGYALSIGVEFSHPVAAEALALGLEGSLLHVVADAEDFPGNVQAVEEEEVQILVRPVLDDTEAADGARKTCRFWLWIVADNLKFAARNAIACAGELNRLRPRGSVQ